MGRLSLDSLVHTTDAAIETAMLDAKKQIFQLVKIAKKEDPSFFAIPYNPFNIEIESDSEEDENSDEDDDDKAKKWLSGLKASPSVTAKEILKVRKELFRKVQLALDDFKVANPSSPITSHSKMFARFGFK